MMILRKFVIRSIRYEPDVTSQNVIHSCLQKTVLHQLNTSVNAYILAKTISDSHPWHNIWQWQFPLPLECQLYPQKSQNSHTARLRQCNGWAAPHYRACWEADAWAANTVLWHSFAVNTVLWHSFARTCSLCCPVLWCNNVSFLSFLNCSTLGNSPTLAFKKLPSSPSLLSFPPAIFLPLSHNNFHTDCWTGFIYQTIRWNTTVYHTR